MLRHLIAQYFLAKARILELRADRLKKKANLSKEKAEKLFGNVKAGL